MTDQQPLDALSTAAEHLRAFNHGSIRPGEHWTFPGHTYDALGTLTQIAARLEQAVEQSIRPAIRTYEHGRLTIDGQADPDPAVAAMLDVKEDAVQAAQELTAALRKLHSSTSAMGLDTEGMEFED